MNFFCFSKETISNLAIRLFSMLCLVLSLLLGVCGCGSQKESQLDRLAVRGKKLDLFLLIGQSNMAGRGPIRQSEMDTLGNVYLFTGTGWEAAANPLNRYSTVRKSLSIQQVGPGYSFAKELAQCTGRKIGLVVNARGGTRIEWWEKGYSGSHDYDLYENTVSQMRKAAKYGHLKGIIWHQGEGNQGNSGAYMALLKQLINDLRSDLGRNVYFVAGELGKWRNSSLKINKVIRSVPLEIENSGYAATDGLTPLRGDSTNPHFDTRSQLILGKRYANRVLVDVYNLKPCKK